MGQRHLIYIFPPNFIFDEVRICYERAAARLGGITVDHDFYSWTPDKEEWNNPDLALVFWGNIPWVLPPTRKAKFAFHYVESVGDLQKMVAEQRKWLSYAISRTRDIDLFIGGTPAARDFWMSLGCQAVASPIGYDPEIMGTPDWGRQKTYDIGFCGVPVGRREWILPAIKRRFGDRFLNVNIFGRARNDAFDFCRMMLYVGHAEEPGFADLRLWSAVSASAALVTERRDAWPAIPGVHYISLDPARQENPEEFVDALEATLKLPLSDFARRMNQDLSAYTVERCLSEFIVPAIRALP